MKGLGVTLGLAVLLSVLLLVVAEPSLAGKPKPGKDHVPPAWGLQEEKPNGGPKDKGSQKPKKPPVAKDPGKKAPVTSSKTITICHKPGTPAEKTLVLPAAAVPGHLQHGDYEGPCQGSAPGVPTGTLPISVTGMITLCHKPGTPAEKTLVLPAAAGPGHLQHGDYEGPCQGSAPGVPTGTLPISATEMVTICHKPGTFAEKTLVLPLSALYAHMQHGDEQGACLEAAVAAFVNQRRWPYTQ
jgi:hypothetical protein